MVPRRFEQLSARGLFLGLTAAIVVGLPGMAHAKQQEAEPPAPESLAFDRQAIGGQLRQLHALLREIGKRDPVPQQEYEQAKLLADQLLEQSRRSGFFWLKTPVETASGLADVPAHLALSSSMADLNMIATRVNQADRIVLTRGLHDFILRFFRDPETRCLQRLPKSGQDAQRDYVGHRVYVESERLQSLRAYLRSQDLISADD